MNFYNRKNELKLLKNIETGAKKEARMTFVVGRRRIGKTTLLLEAFKQKKFVYLFTTKKNEALLCMEFADTVKSALGVEIFGEITDFKSLFSFLMAESQKYHFTLIIDEFQEFMSINQSVYSDMQNIWDRNKGESKMNLILCGSVYSLMSKIFENSKEPLFGRATNRIHLKAFDISTLKQIYSDYYPDYTNDDLLMFYMITGGIAKYVELLVTAGAFTKEKILDEVFSDNSIFIDEGKNVLIDEFGKDYGNYFSILSLIASSKTSRTEIESILQMQVGGYLDRLEKDIGIIDKVKPVFSKPNSRAVKYFITDNFLCFWFRFVYKYRSAVEMGNLEYVKEMVNRDYENFSGRILEKYFTEKLRLTRNYALIGSYWEKSNLNKIDIVAVNELKKHVLFAEVKRNPDKINIKTLKEKSKNLSAKFSEYKIQYAAFSMQDM